MSVTQVMEQYQRILETEVHQLARETGAVKRTGKLDAATFVQTVLFGFWQDPDLRLSGLAQVATRREVQVSESAISQRFSPQSADLFRRVLERIVQIGLESEKVEVPLLKQFSAVIVEDSSTIALPPELAEVWRGCGGNPGVGDAALKLFVQWNVLTGAVQGPRLSDGRTNDHHTPFDKQDLPDGSLYLADLGFFGIKHLQQVAHGKKGKRFFVTRLHPTTVLYTRGGHRLELDGLLPQAVGQVREMGVVLGKQERLPVRLILVKVPEEVAKERQERILRAAQKHGRQPNEKLLKWAHWSIILTNLPRKRATFSQVLVLLRLRWQIERLFRLWKEGGKIDEWRSCKPFRILSECYAKLTAMVLQQALLQEGCWSDPHRSVWKAAASLRREANRLMLAFSEAEVAKTVASILRGLHAGCRLDQRGKHPSTAQLLEDGLDWSLELLFA